MNPRLKEAAQTIFALGLLAVIFTLQSKSPNFLIYSSVVFFAIVIFSRVFRHFKAKNQQRNEDPEN